MRNFAFNSDDPSWKIFIEEVLRNDPDLIALSAYTNHLSSLKTFTKIIKKLSPKCRLLLGGIHVSVDYANLTKQIPEIDYYCIGEGEETFREAVLAITEDKDIESIAGIYSVEQPGKYRSRELIQQIDEIKQPNRCLYPKDYYRNEFHIFSSRGCPFKCNFCSSHKLWTHKTRFHSVQRVLSEVEYIVEELKGDRIIFVDDTFTLDKKRAISIMEGIYERGYNELHFHIGARIDTVDKSMLDIFAKCGVKSMSFGIETGSTRIQNFSHKNLDKERIINILQDAKQMGIHTLTYYIVGHPFEAKEDVQETIDLMKLIGITKINVCAMQPLPGTEVYNEAIKRGFSLDLGNSLEMDQQNLPIINLTNMSDNELKENVHEVYRIANQLSQRARVKQAKEYYFSKLKRWGTHFINK